MSAGRPGSMRAETGRGGRYHHGDLRAALVATAVELIAERGIRDFSLAEASRRLGVAASAPYAHFADRDALLAAVAVHACEVFRAALEPEMVRAPTASERLAALARVYVRFAALHKPLFETLFDAGLDKSRHPEIAAAEDPIDEAFLGCVREISRTGDPSALEALAASLEANAHGHATLLLDGRFGDGDEAVERAAENAARASRALVESRHILTGS